MIALDTSAILAIILGEPEEEVFQRIIAGTQTLVGAPTLVEARLVLEGHPAQAAETVLRDFVSRRNLTVVSFDAMMFEAAIDAFARFGKGRHPALLNFVDCLTYAAAKTYSVPPLFKGNDSIHTDLVPAHLPNP